MDKIKRKKRSDRTHIIYMLTNIQTLERYLGITVVEKGKKEIALIVRWQRHIHRAFTDNKDWALCKSIREHGPLSWHGEIIEVVRGKALAHSRERELIRELNPELNSF
jgi:hypothetical protein